MAGEGGRNGKLGAVFKFERLLTSIVVAGMAVLTALRGFDAPLLAAAAIGLVVALADVGVLAWLDREKVLRQKGPALTSSAP